MFKRLKGRVVVFPVDPLAGYECPGRTILSAHPLGPVQRLSVALAVTSVAQTW